HSLRLPASFHAYDRGVIVKGWPVSLGMGKLVDLLKAFSNITSFKIEIIWDQTGSRAEEEVGEAIAHCIQFYKQLTSLDLSQCRISDIVWQHILVSIPSPDKLRELN